MAKNAAVSRIQKNIKESVHVHNFSTIGRRGVSCELAPVLNNHSVREACHEMFDLRIRE